MPGPELITAHGRTQALSAWSREFGISRQTLFYRLETLKLPPEVALQRCGRVSSDPEAARLNALPWEEDWLAQGLLHRHPHGVDYPLNAALLNVTVKGVQKIEERALRKLRESGADLRALLPAERSLWDGMTREAG